MIEKLKELRDKAGFTNKLWAEKSGVPESTINRILSGKTPNPTMITFAALVRSAGGRIDDFIDDTVRMDLNPEHPEMIEIVENSVKEVTPDQAAKEEHGSFKPCQFHNEVVTMYQTEIQKKDHWLHMMFFALASVVLVVILVLIFDIFNPNIGYFLK